MDPTLTDSHATSCLQHLTNTTSDDHDYTTRLDDTYSFPLTSARTLRLGTTPPLMGPYNAPDVHPDGQPLWELLSIVDDLIGLALLIGSDWTIDPSALG